MTYKQKRPLTYNYKLRISQKQLIIFVPDILNVLHQIGVPHLNYGPEFRLVKSIQVGQGQITSINDNPIAATSIIISLIVIVVPIMVVLHLVGIIVVVVLS